MDEKKMLAILTVVQALQCAAAMFFHEPSSVLIQGVEAENNSDFGFAMAYRDDLKTLVVGAPKATRIGKVFNCEIDRANDMDKISCEEQNIDYLKTDYNTEKFPDQRFYLGASIVATRDYFFTCAPLWTMKVTAIDEKFKKVNKSDSFGTCFVQEDEETNRYQGLLEYYIKSNERKKGFVPIRSPLTDDRITGGTGWSTLVDVDNDLLLIAKPSLKGDFSYVPASNTSLDVKSIADDTRYLYGYWNIGYGLAAGKFFSKRTVYAFSMLQKNMEGLISFLQYKTFYNNKKKKLEFKLSLMGITPAQAIRGKFIELQSHTVGAMFGYTMTSANLNFDELDELIVGAPAQSEDECFECGALHIYTGGDMKTINEPKRLRSIFGTVNFGRFGSAIVAKDLDGDGKPELVVSAPYEKHGSGAIYILSGYEVYHTLMEPQEFKSILWSDLKHTQKIQKESYRSLGFSLQIVDDVDGNGCQELAAGSPTASKVHIFKCVRKINITLSTKLLGNQLVREQDPNFIVNVCAVVQYPSLPDEIIGNITIENSITGEGADVLKPSSVIDISCDSCFNNTLKTYCENITVQLNDRDPRDYTFTSRAKLQNIYLSDKNMTGVYSKMIMSFGDRLRHSSKNDSKSTAITAIVCLEFNRTWVEASLHSKLDSILEVSRHCKGNDCKPHLSMELQWSGSNPYLLGSSANETAKIIVTNDGNASYAACIWFKVYGAPLGQVGCENYKKGYKCYLPSPMKRGTNTSIELELNMKEPRSIQKFVRVVVYLYENCNQESVNKTAQLNITLVLTSDGVFNDGDTHRLNVTDKQILENATVYDHHEFSIRNNGSIKWDDVEFTVAMPKHSYINSFHMENCEMENDTYSSFIIHHCTRDLLPNTTNIIIGTTEIFAGRLNGYHVGAQIKTEYTSTLNLHDTVSNLKTTSVTTITIQKEILLANRKWLIAVIAGIVAFIILAIITFVLCKVGFFRRKQKQKLIVMQESVRRKSVRRNTHASAMDGPAEGLQMDVVDDSPFEEARPVTTKDNVGLVKDDEI